MNSLLTSTLPDWDPATDNILNNSQDELMIEDDAEASNVVLQEWKNSTSSFYPEAEVEDDLDEILMRVDDDDQKMAELVETNDFVRDIFDQNPCASPTGHLEELLFMNLDEDSTDRFLSLSFPALEQDQSQSEASSQLSTFQERYQSTLKKLAESMKHSHETRKSLTMKTPKTENYQRKRKTSIDGVLNSIEESSTQLRNYLQEMWAPFVRLSSVHKLKNVALYFHLRFFAL